MINELIEQNEILAKETDRLVEALETTIQHLEQQIIERDILFDFACKCASNDVRSHFNRLDQYEMSQLARETLKKLEK